MVGLRKQTRKPPSVAVLRAEPPEKVSARSAAGWLLLAMRRSGAGHVCPLSCVPQAGRLCSRAGPLQGWGGHSCRGGAVV